ncbi:MAG: DDE-type integrase/transposase/recombinase, partial [Aggregatilineales bacterium]
EKWVADTTYIPTSEGWLYLVSVMDLFSRQAVGWAMGEHHGADLATSALDVALGRATRANIGLSMSSSGKLLRQCRRGEFLRNGKAGSAIPEGIFASRQQARMALFDYIEVFYNRQRLHSGNRLRPSSQSRRLSNCYSKKLGVDQLDEMHRLTAGVGSDKPTVWYD